MRNIYELAICFFLFCSCTYHKLEVIDPSTNSSNCSDSVYVTYSKSVQPVLNYYCYSCHNSSVTKGGSLGLDLEDYGSLKNYLTLDYRGDGVYGSLFYHCILKAPSAKAMPPDGALNECEIKRIKEWIDSGAPNN